MASYVCPACPRRFRKKTTAKAHYIQAHDKNRGAKKLTRADLGL